MSNIFTTLKSLLANAAYGNIVETTVASLNNELKNPKTTADRREEIKRALEGLHKTQDQREGTYYEAGRNRVS